jgi:DNA-binding transcriptional ArsR family regulator
MARAATTSDAINAIAERRRREILVLLRAGERPVTELARDLGMTQPQASKHLRVLREVGLVRVRGAGKQRLYGLDARGLRPVHEWVGSFERFWSESFDRLDEYVQELKQAGQEGPHDGDDQ